MRGIDICICQNVKHPLFQNHVGCLLKMQDSMPQLSLLSQNEYNEVLSCCGGSMIMITRQTFDKEKDKKGQPQLCIKRL